MIVQALMRCVKPVDRVLECYKSHGCLAVMLWKPGNCRTRNRTPDHPWNLLSVMPQRQRIRTVDQSVVP